MEVDQPKEKGNSDKLICHNVIRSLGHKVMLLISLKAHKLNYNLNIGNIGKVEIFNLKLF